MSKLQFKNNSIYHIDDFKRLYEYYSQGHFFSPSTMRFFNSRISSYSKIIGNKLYFVTSEKFDHNSPRLFTVRIGTAKRGKMNVETFGEFQGFNSLEQAKKAIERIEK